MNVYTKMIDIIKERGLTSKAMLVDEGGSCCLLGCYILSQDADYTKDDYTNGDYQRLNEEKTVIEMADYIRPDWREIKNCKATMPVFRFSDSSSQEEVIAFLYKMAYLTEPGDDY